MAASDRRERVKDLSVPETMKIAQLLAELMPPGADIPQIDLDKSTAPAIDDVAPIFTGSSVEFEESEPIFAAPAVLDTVTAPPAITTVTELPAVQQEAAVWTTSTLALGSASWHSEPNFDAPASFEAPIVAADSEFIPLGDLTSSGFFSLVNWHNESVGIRHPRRSDYGLDEQSLALARTIPFYLAGQPRSADPHSVAAVMAQFVWE